MTAIPNPYITAPDYEELYAASLADPAAFWGEQGARLDWIKPYTRVKDVDYSFGS
ncbi:MAG: acetyl-coenzyme A synthetase N-terminal domain-containing protein, partial [Pseudomonadota bacterium]